MPFKRELMIKVMLNQFHQGAPEVALACLPAEVGKGVRGIETASQSAAYVLEEPKLLIQQTHYSWLAPVIQRFAEDMQPYLLSSLPKDKAVPISAMLKVPLLSKKMASSVRLYFLHKIALELKPASVLPMPFLAATSLTPLLSMRKEEIVQMADFLGLYDLAEEIKHIVDRRSLKAIYGCLSVKKQHFLRICLHQKERLSIPRLGLDRWQGERKTLDALLHSRGLLRLGKGVSGQTEDFLWHLMHHLDTGRGGILQRYYAAVEVPGVTQALIQEILNLMNFFKKNE